MNMEKFANKFYPNLSSIPSPIKESANTRKNIANPGNKAVHHIPVGKAGIAKLRSLPHSGISAGTPNPKNPKLPKTSTASAAFRVKSIGSGVIIFGIIYFIITLKLLAPEICAA